MTLYNFLMTYDFATKVPVEICISRGENEDELSFYFMVNETEKGKNEVIKNYLNHDFIYLEVAYIIHELDRMVVYVNDY